ncbi:MAG: hypothetical protein Q7S92_06625 [Candidatus Diapherotrites archaeon]|nr:hypothetical protein [Candidatus Diapherotrites archaeon]
MVILRGGIKHRKRIRPQGTRVREIKRGKWIGSGNEGTIYESFVTLERNGRQRTVRLAEKEFDLDPSRPRSILAHKSNWQRPLSQFNTMNRLIQLNRAKKLGLRIIPTIRLLKRKGQKPTLVMTRLETDLEMNSRTRGTELDESIEDQNRQLDILRREGYSAHLDAFIIQMNPKTGKGIAVIADFGNIKRLRKN